MSIAWLLVGVLAVAATGMAALWRQEYHRVQEYRAENARLRDRLFTLMEQERASRRWPTTP